MALVPDTYIGWYAFAVAEANRSAGRSGALALEVALFNMMSGRFISEHDHKIGLKLGHIL